MKISQSAVSLNAARSYRAEYNQQESLRVTMGGQVALESTAGQATVNVADLNDIVRISEQASRLNQQRSQPAKLSAPVCQCEQEVDDETNLDPKFEMMRRILEILTGKKIKLGSLKEHGTQPPTAQPPAPVAQNPAASGQSPAVGWGMAYDYRTEYHELEITSINAKGSIVTQDGQEIAFKLDLVMTREYVETTSISIRAGDATLTDPLVVNFAGTAAQLSDMRFSFDLDVDGKNEQVPYLKQGSGYLALDRNHDGMINNGSELFGPSTGSGFNELARYDQDTNGWLDENDSVFADLRIWMQEAGGVGALYTLDQKRIGALLLDSANTEFCLTGIDNALLGKIAQTGIYLTGDGQAGTLQEIDLTS